MWQKKLDVAYMTKPMQFWQNQLNFAIWIASTGCGIGYNPHITKGNYMQRKMYKFSIYYQTRRILSEMSCPIPSSQGFDEFENNIDMTAYERICNEFSINPKTDWKPHGGYGKINFHTIRGVEHIDNYKQTGKTYKVFMLDESKGLTKAGISRINDSVFEHMFGQYWVHNHKVDQVLYIILILKNSF